MTDTTGGAVPGLSARARHALALPGSGKLNTTRSPTAPREARIHVERPVRRQR